MGKKELELINERWTKKLIANGIEDFLIYEPFTDSYWNEDTKITICNLETYGYDDCEIVKVNMQLFEQWMKDTHITKTCRYASLFSSGLIEALSGSLVDEFWLRNNYHNYEKLRRNMESVTYMNIRKISNKNVAQDFNSIMEEAKLYKIELKEYIKALESKILVVGGRFGAMAISTILDYEVKYDEICEIDNMIVCSVRHLSRVSYRYLSDKINKITSKKNLTIAST